MATLAFTSYTELQASIAGYLNRSDLVNEIPGFIALAEAQMKRRLRRKTVRTSIVVAQESTTLPADCAELRSLHFLTSSRGADRPLENVTPEMLAERRASYGAAGRPTAFSMIGGQLVVAPEPNTSYTGDLVYFQQFTSLSASNASNAVLVEAPDLYLFGALKEAAPYLEHDERVATWTQKYETALAELEAVREREETAASLRPVRFRAF